MYIYIYTYIHILRIYICIYIDLAECHIGIFRKWIRLANILWSYGDGNRFEYGCLVSGLN